jgi:hypothetical protein
MTRQALKVPAETLRQRRFEYLSLDELLRRPVRLTLARLSSINGQAEVPVGGAFAPTKILDEMRRPVSKRDAFVTKLPRALEVQ